MKKQTIKLNESQLNNIIKESIKKVLKENSSFDKDIEEIKNIISRLHTIYKESNKRYEELPSALINAQEGSSLSYDTKLLGEAIDILVKYLKHNGAEYDFYQTVYENTKKMLKESNSPIVIGDEDCGDLYSVTISNGDYSSVVFNVYCYSAQDALDEAVDYAENQGWNGLFDDEDEEAINEFPDDYITAGNHGHYLRIDSFVVRKV